MSDVLHQERTARMSDVRVRMVTGDWSTMAVCGSAPAHNGQKTIVVTNGEGCFAARLTPDGYVIIEEPVKLYPVLQSLHHGYENDPLARIRDQDQRAPLPQPLASQSSGLSDACEQKEGV